ncbi:MAG: hypothetical protein IKD66_14405 [Solobacterium sp.]|nr:hypothetical protein [Solobacterium sp.]
MGKYDWQANHMHKNTGKYRVCSTSEKRGTKAGKEKGNGNPGKRAEGNGYNERKGRKAIKQKTVSSIGNGRHKHH